MTLLLNLLRLLDLPHSTGLHYTQACRKQPLSRNYTAICRKMKKVSILCCFTYVLHIATVCFGQIDCDSASIGNPESNILNKKNSHDFTFTVFPAPLTGWGHGKNAADERQWLYNKNWPIYGFQSKADAEGVAYISVNLKKPYFVRAFAVTGYPGGSRKPIKSFFLEGSNDGTDWKMVAEGRADQWHAPGTYPFRPSQIVKAQYPGRYQYYRVIARGWTNGYMVIYNWGLFS